MRVWSKSGASGERTKSLVVYVGDRRGSEPMI